jgi:predicted dehydrogenase
MKKSKITFGIVGCGRIAVRHAEHINRLGELVAVCDIVPKKAEELASKYQAKAYLDINDLNAHPDIDVISVCTPNGLHAEHSIAALKTGHHVLCEKPMAIKVADCREMIRAAKTANKHLFIVKQNRFNPPVAALKKVLDEKRLGKIFSVQLNCFWNRHPEYYANSWKGTKVLDGGSLFTQFAHFIDLLYWLIGDINKVYALTANLGHKGMIEIEDTGVIALKFKNGALGTINYTVNSFNKNMEGSLTVFGQKGTIKIGGQYLNELEYQEIEGYKIKNLPPGNPANNYGQYVGSMSNHDKVYENVIEVLTKNGKIATNGEEGLKTVEIIEKIYAAAKKHK